MTKKTFTNQISTDEIRAYKQDKITVAETLQYNEERTLSDMDLVYWKYIKDILPDSETMSFIGSVDNESDLPDDVAYGTVALIGNTVYIYEDGEWIKTGVETFAIYGDIPALLNDQSNQNDQQILIVTDASDDESIKFAPAVTKKYALYKYNEDNTESLGDYELLSAPYGVNTYTVDTFSTQKIDGPKEFNQTVNIKPKAGDTTSKSIILTDKDGGRVSLTENSIILLGKDGGSFSVLLNPDNSNVDILSPLVAKGPNSTTKLRVLAGKTSENDRALMINGRAYYADLDILIPKLEDADLVPKKFVEQLRERFTTQEISTGGNYNNLEVTADLLVFTNENAQAILNGVWGKKEFHILNLSNTYEVQINHNSSSVSGNGKPIKLPTNSGTAGIKGTARVLYTEDYGYFVADTWASKYRPEFKDLPSEEVMTVNENSVAGTKKIIELRVFRDSQATPMSKEDLNTAYPDAVRGFEVICKTINKTYMKVDDNTDDWVVIDNTLVQ